MASFSVTAGLKRITFKTVRLDTGYTYVKFIYKVSPSGTAYYTDWVLSSEITSSGYIIKSGETQVRTSPTSDWVTASISSNTVYVVNAIEAKSSSGEDSQNFYAQGPTVTTSTSGASFTVTPGIRQIDFTNITLDSDYNYIRFVYRLSTSSTAYYTAWMSADDDEYSIKNGQTRVRTNPNSGTYAAASISSNTTYVVNAYEATSSSGIEGNVFYAQGPEVTTLREASFTATAGVQQINFTDVTFDSGYTYVMFVYRLSTSSTPYYTAWMPKSAVTSGYTIKSGETQVRTSSTSTDYITASISPSTAYTVNAYEATSSSGATNQVFYNSNNAPRVTTLAGPVVNLIAYKVSDTSIRIDTSVTSGISSSHDCALYYRESGDTGSWSLYGDDYFRIYNNFKTITIPELNSSSSYDFKLEDADIGYNEFLYNINLATNLLMVGYDLGSIKINIKNPASGYWTWYIRPSSNAEINVNGTEWTKQSVWVGYTYPFQNLSYGNFYDIMAAHSTNNKIDYALYVTRINCAPTEGDLISKFSHETWNFMIDSIYHYRNNQWAVTNGYNLSRENTKITTSPYKLTAAKFNQLWYNLKQINSQMSNLPVASNDPTPGTDGELHLYAHRFYYPDVPNGWGNLNDGLKAMDPT